MSSNSIAKPARATSVLLLAFMALVVGACKAGPAADSGFLADSELLTEQRDLYPFHKVWVSPEWNNERFQTLVVSTVNMDYIKENGWWKQATLKGGEETMKTDLANLAVYTQNEFQKKFREDKNSRYRVIEAPQRDSLILEMALIEVVPNKASLGALGIAASFVAAPVGVGIAAKETAKGAVAIEARWRRADNGEIVAMFADREAGKFGPWNLRRATWYGHTHKIIQEWAQQWVRIANAEPGQKIKDTARFTLKPW